MACNFVNHCKSFSIGLSYMLVILIYQLLSFGVCLFLSVVCAIFLAFTFEFCWGYTLPTFIICFLQACVLITSVKLHTSLHDGSVGLGLADKIKEYPVFLNMIPSIFTIILSFGAYYEAYTEYYTVHIAPNELNPNKSVTPPDNQSSPRNFQAYGNEKGPYIDNTVDLLLRQHSRSFIIFIVCFSYLIYNMAKVIQRDSTQQLEGRRHRIGKFSTIVILFNLVSQAALTFGYAIPIIYVAIFARMLHASYGAVFFYISAIAAFLGIGASYVETKDPFPQIRNLPPFYFYECQVKARILLLKYGLLPFVYYWFLNFYDFLQVPFSGNPEEHRFFLFTLSFAVLILQTIKIVSYGMLVSRHPLYAFRRRRRPREVDPDEQIVDQDRLVRPGHGAAQAVDPIPHPGLVDPTMVQDNTLDNNNLDAGLAEEGADTDTDQEPPTDTSRSSKSSRGQKGKRHKRRAKAGKGPNVPSDPANNVLMINQIIDDWLDEVRANCEVTIEVQEEVQVGPSSRNPEPCSLQPGPCQLQPGPCQVQPGPCQVLPGPSSVQPNPQAQLVPYTVSNDEASSVVNNEPADTVIDFNNND